MAVMSEHVTCALLGQLLLAYGAITSEQLDLALVRQEGSGEPLGEILIQMGATEPEHVERALRAQARLRGRQAQGHAFLLLVDDDPEIGAVLGEILEGAGYRVGVAENTAEAGAALTAADGVRPALVVLDIGLPGPSGIDFLILLRGDPELTTTPVIVLTGQPQFEDEIRDRNLTISDFLCKPVSARRLLEAVNNALQHSRVGARA
jgi:CheY-like chemotaxis protein